MLISHTLAQEVITINVQPGWKDGTRITYAGLGDELPGQPAQARCCKHPKMLLWPELPILAAVALPRSCSQPPCMQPPCGPTSCPGLHAPRHMHTVYIQAYVYCRHDLPVNTKPCRVQKPCR